MKNLWKKRCRNFSNMKTMYYIVGMQKTREKHDSLSKLRAGIHPPRLAIRHVCCINSNPFLIRRTYGFQAGPFHRPLQNRRLTDINHHNIILIARNRSVVLGLWKFDQVIDFHGTDAAYSEAENWSRNPKERSGQVWCVYLARHVTFAVCFRESVCLQCELLLSMENPEKLQLFGAYPVMKYFCKDSYIYETEEKQTQKRILKKKS